MLISNNYNNYYNNFSAFVNYTNKDNKIKILTGLIIVGLAVAYVAYYSLCKRINTKQDLSDQDQQINDHAKQKFSPPTSHTQQKSFAPNQLSSKTTTQKQSKTVTTKQETSPTNPENSLPFREATLPDKENDQKFDDLMGAYAQIFTSKKADTHSAFSKDDKLNTLSFIESEKTLSTQSNQIPTHHLVRAVTPLETEQVTPLSRKKNKLFTFGELMTTTDLTQDELFSYAEDSCRKSAQEGLALMTRAAQMGHVEAMFMVGQLYRFGNRTGDKPVKKDISQALIWLEKAAHAGNHKACGYLANMYLNGDDICLNTKEGAKWLLLGFKNGAKTIGIDAGYNRVILSNETQAKEYLKQKFFVTVG